MSVDLITIGVLVAMFVVATLTPINMGLMGFAAAFVVGGFLGMDAKEVARALPADLLITLLGITYLFALAQANGAVARIVTGATRAVGGRAVAMPWLLFLIAAGLTGFGALSPAAVAILAPLAMSFARRHGLNPLTTGLLVIHGAQAGGFSPLSIYGGITRKAVESGGLPFNAYAPFVFSLALNTAAAVLLVLVMHRFGVSSASTTDVEKAPQEEKPGSVASWVTLLGLAALAVLTLTFKLEVGFVAIVIGLLLSTVALGAQRQVLQRLPWSEVVLIMGVATYVAVLQKIGVIDRVGEAVAAIGSPALAALLILYIGAVVSAFASSAAVLGSLIPLALPLMRDQPPTLIYVFIGAMAVASTIVDVSPFSTNGALVLASAPEEARRRLFMRLVLYGALVTALAPLALWLIYLLLGGG